MLACLDADRERAGEKYEALRLLLVKFFDWRGTAFPEEQADVTLDRVARKIEEGEQIRNLTSYCYGVARFLFLETLKGPESRRDPLDEIDPVAASEATEEKERRVECFEGCLGKLPTQSREVILQYYQDERRVKIDHRKSLAERLGIPLNALRSRAQRMRDKLEHCVHECLDKE